MKFLKHDRDKVGDYQRRLLMHIPVGMLIGIPILGIPLYKLFEKYEDNEDFWTHDRAWKDYGGAVVGACITVVILTGLGIWFIFQ